MTNVGFATLSVIPSFDGFRGKLEKGTAGPLAAAGLSGGRRFGDTAGRTAGSRFGGAFKTAAKASLIGVGALTAGAFAIGKDAVSEASDLGESLNAVNVSFGRSSRAIKRLGRQAADSLGLSNQEFNSLSVRFSAFTKTIAGGDSKKVVGTLDDLTTRAADFASVMNLDVNEAAQLFQSGLAGESEPLRKFGVDMSAASVQAFAYANGIAEAGAKLTEGEKVQARYAALMEQTSQVQGDFANTSDSLANRQRILNARWDDAQAKLGKALLPIVEDFAGFLIDEGIPAVERFSDWFNEVGGPALDGFIDKAKPLVKRVLPEMRDLFGEIKDFAGDAVPYAEGIVKAFNDMPSWAKKALIGGGAAAFAANKIGNPLGALGALRGSTAATPMYVKVVGGTGVGADGDGKGGGVFGNLLKGFIGFQIGDAISDALPTGANPFGSNGNDGFLGSVGLGRDDITGTFDRLNERFGFGEAQEKIDDTKTALERVKEQLDTNRLAHDKFLASVDKTPRQIDMRVTLQGYKEAYAQLLALNSVGAGGVPNSGAEATPRGFGSEVTINTMNVTANTTREIADSVTQIRRRRARAGH